jgi:hypothetical protein
MLYKMLPRASVPCRRKEQQEMLQRETEKMITSMQLNQENSWYKFRYYSCTQFNVNNFYVKSERKVPAAPYVPRDCNYPHYPPQTQGTSLTHVGIIL